ncbi:hypothetical protein AN643_03650 [Candidatus Epulonipiscioides saccharophilum]|nr:hypothetical protein AN643_03650 [Epulopiscium sp. SCG-B10WGA-EpuloB]
MFKGGSAVQILLGDRWSRLSTDVDITTGVGHNEIKYHLSKINRKFQGKYFSYEKRRGFPSGTPFYLYRLKTMPITGDERTFLLDIQGVEVDYITQSTPLNSFFYESDIMVHTPTISSILGDKLSILGPSTIGRKLEDSRNGLEYAKHILDIHSLASNIRDFSQSRSTYQSIIGVQSKIRGKNYRIDDCVDDGLDICKVACLPLNGEELIRESKDGDKIILRYYSTLRKGLERIQSFMINRRIYSWEDLREYSSEAALLLSMIKKKASHKECVKILKIKPPENMEIIRKQLKDLKTLPEKEKWFIDFEELATSPKVLNNLHKLYFKV